MASQFELRSEASDLLRLASVGSSAAGRPSLFDPDCDTELDDAPPAGAAAWRSAAEVGESVTRLCPISAAACGAVALRQFPRLVPGGVDADVALSSVASLRTSLCVDSVLHEHRSAQQRVLLAEAMGSDGRRAKSGKALAPPRYSPPLFVCGAFNYVGTTDTGVKLYRSPRTNVVQPLVEASGDDPRLPTFDAALEMARAVDDSQVKRHLAEEASLARRLEVLCNEQFAAFAEVYYSPAATGGGGSGGATDVRSGWYLSSVYVRDRSEESIIPQGVAPQLPGASSGASTSGGGGGGGSARMETRAGRENERPAPLGLAPTATSATLEVDTVILRRRRVAAGSDAASREWAVCHCFLVEMTRDAIRVTQRTKTHISLPSFPSDATNDGENDDEEASLCSGDSGTGSLSRSAAKVDVLVSCEYHENLNTVMAGATTAGSPLLLRGSVDSLASSFNGTVIIADAVDIGSQHALRQVVEVLGAMVQSTENAHVFPVALDVALRPAMSRLSAFASVHRAGDAAAATAPESPVTPHAARAAATVHDRDVEQQRAQRNADAARLLAAAVKGGSRKRASDASLTAHSDVVMKQS